VEREPSSGNWGAGMPSETRDRHLRRSARQLLAESIRDLERLRDENLRSARQLLAESIRDLERLRAENLTLREALLSGSEVRKDEARKLIEENAFLRTELERIYRAYVR
jgi:hypothetical protein